MKTTTRIFRINSNLLPVTFDIGKDRLYAYTELPLADHAAQCVEEVLSNRNASILNALNQFHSMALEHGFQGICILCEPTGGFENRLLRLARQSGHCTANLNAESVRKLRVVQSNDSSKTDLKDPRTMFTLARLGKTLTHRHLSGRWLVLREITGITTAWNSKAPLYAAAFRRCSRNCSASFHSRKISFLTAPPCQVCSRNSDSIPIALSWPGRMSSIAA